MVTLFGRGTIEDLGDEFRWTILLQRTKWRHICLVKSSPWQSFLQPRNQEDLGSNLDVGAKQFSL